MLDFSRKSIKNTVERAVILTLLGIFTALLVISLANDIYAFVKPEGEVSLSFSSTASLSEISKTLQKEGIIKNPTVFSTFVRLKQKQDILQSFVGTAYFSKNMSYREIILAFSQK